MILQKVVASVATGAMLSFALVVPAYADNTISISGNGADSVNQSSVNSTNTSSVVQNNTAVITNNVSANANSGDNKASENTGGSVDVSTGGASTSVDVTNQANLNKADASSCSSCGTNTSVDISGNGADTYNKANVGTSSNNTVFQNNDAQITNQVSQKAETGDNKASSNTGGDVSITTGPASSSTTIKNQANANIASSSSGSGDGSGGTLTATISGNGADSHNGINIYQNSDNSVVQSNDAVFNNMVYAKASSGDNKAWGNTSGDVMIDTGAADSTVNIDNMANFNYANVDCCLTNTEASITNNGADTKNWISAKLGNTSGIFQGGEGKGNLALLNNTVKPNTETGDNSAGENTANDSGMFWLSTGDNTSDTTLNNQANVNLVGFNPGVELGFDLGNLWQLVI
ncbi:hypothetical protein M1563_03175 [Patescibacteria group bacterium]|nr:hypothetical protein [Patescibacteria group bacterium]MCL5409781.1 hypothetical protein [Patescibacteria group bacterium]